MKNISLIGTLVLLSFFTQSSLAREKWYILGNTVWVSGDNRLTLDMPSVQHADLIITSNSAGDFQWIETTIPVIFGSKIKMIGLCFQTPDTGTFISQIRLSEYLVPPASTVQHDDGTDLFDTQGKCYFSPIANYRPNGSVNLSLRLNFANPGDKIRLGAMAVLFGE